MVLSPLFNALSSAYHSIYPLLNTSFISRPCFSDVGIPKLLESMQDKKIKQAVCGSSHTGFITESGSLFLVGSGRNGQLGTDLRSLPYRNRHYQLFLTTIINYWIYEFTK